MDGDQLQQGDDDVRANYRPDVSRNSTSQQHSVVDERRAVSPASDGVPAGLAAGNCPHGGSHQARREGTETFCHKCFEPLDESEETQTSFDFEAVDETCQFWIDNCPLLERVKLSNALKVWAQKAKEIK